MKTSLNAARKLAQITRNCFEKIAGVDRVFAKENL